MGIIMKQKKINCWEFKRCGREPGGINSAEGVCPVALEQRADGVHDGLNGGRCCWVLRDNLCQSTTEKRGKLSKAKNTECLQCDFYHLVRKEEIPYFKVTGVVLNEIKRRGHVELHA